MSVDGVFELLPPHGLDQSILLAVLIGLVLILFLTEVFGWVFVGLVVPGYLASVALIQPASAIAVVFESLLTYGLAYLVSELFPRTQSWSPFFGRERFLMIVLVSVFVRQNSQIWMLPLLLGYVDQTFGTTLYTDLDFYSIGLVLIPLTANMFWKLGLWRGSLQVAVPTLITYSLLRFLLLPYTNLSFANLALTYENVALDFLGSPKAYMILLTGAFLAAQYNLRYGWDYSGILVPSLLALAWFTPLTVVVTLGEALLLFFVTRTVLGLPAIRRLNFEGPRKVSVVFTIGFILKYVVGWGLYYLAPDARVTDYFGFGYVLTSLLAAKMLTKKVIGRVLLPTAQVSLTAFLIGSVVGYGLERLTPSEPTVRPAIERDQTVTRMLVREPLGVMVLAEVRARSSLPPELRDGRPGRELRSYGMLWRDIDRWLAGTGSVSDIYLDAQELGFDLRRLERSFVPGEAAFALFEREERLGSQTGWDTALLVPGAPGPYIEVPAPRSQTPAAQAAALLCGSMQCRAVLVSGGDASDRSAADVSLHPRASFQVAHGELASASIVQLHADWTVTRGRPVLHLQHTLPADVHLDRLWPREIELSWEPPPMALQQWQRNRQRLVVFRVHPVDLVEHLTASASPPPAPIAGVDILTFTAPLVEPSASAVDSPDRDFVFPSESELRFLEVLLADPLLAAELPAPSALAGEGSAGASAAQNARFTAWLHRLAQLVDYRLAPLTDCAGVGQGCWVLAPEAAPMRFPVGLLAVRVGDVEPIAVEVPRPQREGGTFRIGAELWREVRGRILLVNPDETLTGPGMKLDPTIIGNPVTPFQALHQAIHHSLARAAHAPAPAASASEVAPASPQPRPGLVLQIRGFGGWRPIGEDLVIGMGAPVMQTWQIPARIKELVAPEGPLGWLSDAMRYADGSDELITLSGQGTPQLSYTRSLGDVDFAMLWLSEPARESFRPASRSRYREHFDRVGLGLIDRTVAEAIGFPELVPTQRRLERTYQVELDHLLELTRHYAVTRDIHVLRALQRETASRPGRAIDALWSNELGLPFLRIELLEGRQVGRAIVLLHPRTDRDCGQSTVLAPGFDRDFAFHLFRRCGVLTIAGDLEH
ncbi:MAG TPA: poly-gamma-glutamate biosynthesis protein PgsC/CapC [Haliangium sp.]|nr:poly-gamma-glutamate biosynthesis protein PgsC/CapC [Haliangium sp.]